MHSICQKILPFIPSLPKGFSFKKPLRGGSQDEGDEAANSQGFSLLEVMVATTLMGLVLVVLLQVLTGAIWAQETSLGHARALQTADKVLQECCNTANLTERSYQGQDGAYSYQVRVTPQYTVNSPATIDQQVRCSLIQVTVSWEERSRKHSVSLETIRAASQKRT